MVASIDTSPDTIGGKDNEPVEVSFRVDNKDRKINKVTRNGNEINETPIKSLDEIAVSTSQMEFTQWVKAVLTIRPSFTLPIFLPLLVFTSVAAFLWYVQTGNLAVIPFVPFIPGFITYQIVKRQLTTPAIIIRKHYSGEFYMQEDEFWNWDYWKFPEETKKFNGKSWIAWIDCRNEINGEIKAFEPWAHARKRDDSEINASDIMGMESYLKSAFNIGNIRPQESFIEANLPYIAIIVGGFVAVFFAASRVQEMLGV